MAKQIFVTAFVLFLLIVCGIIGFWGWEQRNEREKLQAQLSSAGDSLKTLQEEISQLKLSASELEELATTSKSRIAELEKEREQYVSSQKTLEDQMRAALQSKDITISELQGKLTVNILDRILFNSGEAEIKPEGQKVLQQIAEVLKNFPSRQIYVVGHTDNVPIRVSARSRFPSNWELSTARATAAVRFLQDNAGVDPFRLAAVGHGEFHPVAPNANEEGRSKNRRIEVVVLPEEFSKPVESPKPGAQSDTPISDALGRETSETNVETVTP